MCGIAGFLDGRSGTPGIGARVIEAMTDTLVHRGPDDGGTWSDAKTGIALGNRRLAIIDLSEAGHQPMTSSCDRYVIAYNGEIYNAGELREELEQKGCSFHGYSDTEVLLEGCAQWGVEETAKRIIGMFALHCGTSERNSYLWCVTGWGSSPYSGVSMTVCCFLVQN